jgi:hypothetical protein
MESPTGEGVPQLDDELEPDQVGGSEPEQAIGSAVFGGVLVPSEQHRPIIQGCAEREIWGDRELDPWTPQPMFPPSLHRVVQRRVLGSTYYYAAAAWRGQLLGGWAARKVVAHPAPTGPATVLQYRSTPELATFSERIVAGFGMSGLFGIEYIVDDEDGKGYLVEINRRITPGLHKGAPIGRDLCGALREALTEDIAPSRRSIDLDAGEEYISVNFPQEWLRDPTSDWMRNYAVDVPWDDPDLLHSMLELRHE